jgi:hypothetical protein
VADRTGEDVVAIPVSRGWESHAAGGAAAIGDEECGTRTPSDKVSLPSLDLVAHQA